jgi:hypothetical protein
MGSPYVVGGAMAKGTKVVVAVAIVIVIVVIVVIAMNVGGSATAPAPKAPYEYVGCYQDDAARTLKSRILPDTTFNKCYESVKSISPVPGFFGLQNSTMGESGLQGQCWYGDAGYDRIGTATNCEQNDGIAYGRQWSNAVYKINK